MHLYSFFVNFLVARGLAIGLMCCNNSFHFASLSSLPSPSDFLLSLPIFVVFRILAAISNEQAVWTHVFWPEVRWWAIIRPYKYFRNIFSNETTHILKHNQVQRKAPVALAILIRTSILHVFQFDVSILAHVWLSFSSEHICSVSELFYCCCIGPKLSTSCGSDQQYEYTMLFQILWGQCPSCRPHSREGG